MLSNSELTYLTFPMKL